MMLLGWMFIGFGNLMIHALKRTGGKKGIASLCIGGGEAVAVALELI